MDKFGIFKLISSFMDFYSKNKLSQNHENSNTNVAQSQTPQPVQSNQKTGETSIANLLTSIFNNTTNSVNNTAQQNNAVSPTQIQSSSKQNTPQQNAPSNLPLQSKMLAVMSAHDAFVKKITKNKQPPNNT